jgi:glutaredoxin
MALLDKLGKKAFDTIEKATRAVERAGGELKRKAQPLIDASPLAKQLSKRLQSKQSDDESFVVPNPEPNVSPFAEPDVEADASLAAQLYGRGTDPWTQRCRRLLQDREIDFLFIDLEEGEGPRLEARLVGETGQQAAPFVFLRGESIGGFNALNEIDRLGQLEHLTTPEDERSKGRIRIQVAQRGGDETAPGERGNADERK